MSAEFASARLRMRPQRPDDDAALHEAYRDAELMRWWSSAPHADVAASRAYLIEGAAMPEWRGWTITLAGDDQAIGTLASHPTRAGVAEIGYLLVRRFWGQGYAQEAVTALVDLLFAEGMRRVFADVDPENAASIALLARLGFVHEGVLRAEWETHIGVRDALIMAVLRDEWRARL